MSGVQPGAGVNKVGNGFCLQIELPFRMRAGKFFRAVRVERRILTDSAFSANIPHPSNNFFAARAEFEDQPQHYPNRRLFY